MYGYIGRDIRRSESLSVFRRITIRPSEEVLNLYRLVSSLRDMSFAGPRAYEIKDSRRFPGNIDMVTDSRTSARGFAGTLDQNRS